MTMTKPGSGLKLLDNVFVSKKTLYGAATDAVSEGRVLLGGAPYAWEADEMAFWPKRPTEEGRAEAIAHERERCHFTVREREGAPPPGAPPPAAAAAPPDPAPTPGGRAG